MCSTSITLPLFLLQFVMHRQNELTHTEGHPHLADLRERVCAGGGCKNWDAHMRAVFTGIAGGEVALHKLGIHMRAVVSVEILDDVRAAMARK